MYSDDALGRQLPLVHNFHLFETGVEASSKLSCQYVVHY